jgi:threonine/homoserine/homoserine lactone efflux protein
MDVMPSLFAFGLVAGLLTITPGLDTALVLRSAMTQGRQQAFATALGISAGLLVWGVSAAAGIAAVVTVSTAIYTALRLIGAAYMVWLGLRILRLLARQEAHPAKREADGSAADVPASAAWRSWRQGLLTNLLNPKVGAFYVAVLPPFIPPDSSPLVLGLALAGVHIGESLLWFTVMIVAVQSIRPWLSRRSVQRVIEGMTGTVLIGFGVKLGLSSR